LARELKVIVGYDRRFLSDRFAQITAEVFAGNDFQVILTPEPTPTPSVSFAVKHLRAVGGVMITASHNPPIFNGFKLKSYYGGSSDSETCQAVESFLDKNPVAEPCRCAERPPAEGGKDQNCRCPPRALCRAEKTGGFQADREIKLRFAHDALFGVGAGCFEQLLAGTTCKVTTLNGKHDPLFGGINPEPIVQNYARSQAFLKKHPHDICLVTDGDADRVGGMDGRGNYLTTHQIICLLLHHLSSIGRAGDGSSKR
jgi:phosphomannomutase